MEVEEVGDTVGEGVLEGEVPCVDVVDAEGVDDDVGVIVLDAD